MHTVLTAGESSNRSFAVCRCCCYAVVQWKTPDAFLEDDLNRDEGQPPLAPPQIYEMYNLRTFHSLEGLLAECKKRQKIGSKCWMPVYQLCRDAVLFLLPGALFHSFSSSIIFVRSTRPSRPNNIRGGLRCPSVGRYVRTYVCTSVQPQKVFPISMKFGV